MTIRNVFRLLFSTQPLTLPAPMTPVLSDHDREEQRRLQDMLLGIKRLASQIQSMADDESQRGGRQASVSGPEHVLIDRLERLSIPCRVPRHVEHGQAYVVVGVVCELDDVEPFPRLPLARTLAAEVPASPRG